MSHVTSTVTYCLLMFSSCLAWDACNDSYSSIGTCAMRCAIYILCMCVHYYYIGLNLIPSFLTPNWITIETRAVSKGGGHWGHGPHLASFWPQRPHPGQKIYDTFFFLYHRLNTIFLTELCKKQKKFALSARYMSNTRFYYILITKQRFYRSFFSLKN